MGRSAGEFFRPALSTHRSLNFKSPERTSKIDFAIERRQPTLTVVLENIHDPHNVNAILRSCDAVGILNVHLVYYIEQFPKLAHTTSSGAYKWLEYKRHDSIKACIEELRSEGFHIFATKLDSNAKPLYENNLTSPTAFILGNEHRGISVEAADGADELLYIPMMGMAESLNVSVASAVCLFEALRQREEAGLYASPQLSPEALRSKRLEWLLK
jgi:tRNA (guanosine-2'-O-)-methyltransferase